MKKNLTQLENDALASLMAYQKRFGQPPTRSELAKVLRLRGKNARQIAQSRIRRLADKGWIKLSPVSWRNIEIL